jgi:hypothetical protein
MVRAKVADQEAELAELERLKPWLAGWANYKDRFEQLKAVAES